MNIKHSLLALTFGLATNALMAKELTGNFYQIKMGAGVTQAGSDHATIPMLSLGKRFEFGEAAIEVLGTWGGHTTTNGSKNYYFTLPKISYLNFYEPNSKQSIYYGGGLSWGKVQSKPINANAKSTQFTGVFGEATVGYELKRTTEFRTMLDFTLSQPMIAQSRTGHHPGPTALFGMSLGF